MRRRTRHRHTARHSAYRSQFVVVGYPWHPLYGQRVRVYGRQGRAGRQILYIEVRPGLSCEIPAWMCDAAACAAVSSGSPRLAIAALTEPRAMLDSHSGKPSPDRSSLSSRVKEYLDEAPSKWWTPLLSSGGSGKVSNEPGTASFYG